MPDKLSKQQAGYVHKESTEYNCVDCFAWMPSNQCFLHAPDVRVPLDWTCNNWADGPLIHLAPIGALTPAESGLAARPAGASCKRCAYWNQETWDCGFSVDRESLGDDPSLIHPNACCNYQDPDSVRGNLPTAALRALGVYNDPAPHAD